MKAILILAACLFVAGCYTIQDIKECRELEIELVKTRRENKELKQVIKKYEAQDLPDPEKELPNELIFRQ